MHEFSPTAARLGIVRGISYGLFGQPDSFLPEMRDLGSTLARVYVYWSQVEPEPGRFDWSVVDAILGQATESDELWVTVCSSSLWATREKTTFLPPSPAIDAVAYERFVHELVAHCRGRVHLWQCNNEPSNTGLLWAGTAAEYVAQLIAFHGSVRAADSDALVVLGGCGYDCLSAPDGSAPRQFFDHVVDRGRDAFDVFSVHLYDNPALIAEHVETARGMMRTYGYERPVVVGEYNGPTLFEFPELGALLEETMAAAFTDGGGVTSADATQLVVQAEDAPDRRAMRALYARMAELPPQLQMFMEGCAPELAAKRDRINCRQLVTRNVLALSTGVMRTACWNLAPEIPNYTDPYNLMGFLFAKLVLLDYSGTALTSFQPAARTFRLVAEYLGGAQRVSRIPIAGRSDLQAFEVQRSNGEPVHVLWKDAHVFSGEDDAPEVITWDWPGGTGHIVDAFGAAQQAKAGPKGLEVSVSVTPVFISAVPGGAYARPSTSAPSRSAQWRSLEG